jgi:hypothetical protein
MIPHTIEPVLQLVRKAAGQRLLGTGQDIHRKQRHLQDGTVHFGLVIHTDRDQWRVERYR